MSSSADTPHQKLYDHVSTALGNIRGLLNESLIDVSNEKALELVKTALGHLQSCEDILDMELLPNLSQAVILNDSDFFKGNSSLMPPSMTAQEDSSLIRKLEEIPVPKLDEDDDLFGETNMPDADNSALAIHLDPILPETSEDLVERALLVEESSHDFPSDESLNGANQMSMEDFDANRSKVLQKIETDDSSFALYDTAMEAEDDTADAELSRVFSRIDLEEETDARNTEAKRDDGASPCTSTTELVLDRETTFYPALTPVRFFALLLRHVAQPYAGTWPPKTIYQGLSMGVPSTPRLRGNFTGGRSRKPRVVERSVPENFQLTDFVYCEQLGDCFEEVVYKILFKAEGEEELTEELARKAFDGSLEEGVGELDQDAVAVLRSAQRSMNDIRTSAREGDIEHHFRRTHCEILSTCLKSLAIQHYVRSGTSAFAEDREGETIPGVYASPDVEDIFHDSEEDKSATEMKTSRSLKNAFITALLHIAGNKESLEDLLEQLEKCPGYAHRFVWPPEDVYMRNEEQMVVQVYTAMVFKKLRVYELSSSDRSVFFFRPSLESTTLYVSRVYNTPDFRATEEDLDTPNCMTNLTRFAMRYIAAHDLYDKVAKLLPPVKKEHWDAVDEDKHGLGNLYGIDDRTSWKTTGCAFYTGVTDGQQPTMRSKLRSRKKRAVNP